MSWSLFGAACMFWMAVSLTRMSKEYGKILETYWPNEVIKCLPPGKRRIMTTKKVVSFVLVDTALMFGVMGAIYAIFNWMT